MRIIQNILRESKKSSKKKPAEDAEKVPDPIKTVNIKIGDREWDNFPESETRRITNLIRQIVRGTLNSGSVIDDLVNQVPRAKQDKLRKVLDEINKEHGSTIVSKIPDSFPFLAAEDGTEFYLSGLDSDSMDFLNTEHGTTGRGEVAIALIFGVEEFLTAKEKDPEPAKGRKRKPSVSSYDLVYKGKQCDVKDARTMLKDGYVKLENYVRLGGVASRRVELSIDDVLSEYNFYLRARDFFANQTNALEPLAFLALQDESVKNSDQMLSTCTQILEEIMIKVDAIIEDHLKQDYEGGIFIITKEKIRLYSPSEFKMYALKGDGRLSIEYVDSEEDETYFKRGLLDNLKKSKDRLFNKYLSEKSREKSNNAEEIGSEPAEHLDVSKEVPEESPEEEEPEEQPPA